MDKIIQLVKEKPRTVKELAEALGVSKKEAYDLLQGLPFNLRKTVTRNGKPIIMFEYCCNK